MIFKWRGALNRLKKGIIITELYPKTTSVSSTSYKMSKGKIYIRYAHAPWNYLCHAKDWYDRIDGETEFVEAT
jgi:hypothetical protein